ncbi:HisA/HisF-related TIM barrel protein [Pelomonas sp. KK5]|uniref:HisA/HisF-related TIM barrel protein n=1 Tax=Pelomonas sp. KK5 TaxID=1855730 RepID=UPI001E33CDA4|nr:HisA/HisF-related TIM barrel protein [Pelomonas sp. KK5]
MDLLGGQVVRGVGGDRQAYRPIVSALCRGSSEPLEVARRLCAHAASELLYVADLDALQGGAVQLAVLQRLLRAMPSLHLWLDAGFADAAAAGAVLAQLEPGRVLPVFGSESLRSIDALAACFDAAATPALLSLDRRQGRAMDPAGCWQRPDLWPAQVIVMTLERVGAGTGPDLQTLAQVAAACPRARLIGAGGVAGDDDLRRAAAAGASAWLVASALHDLKLSPRDC